MLNEKNKTPDNGATTSKVDFTTKFVPFQQKFENLPVEFTERPRFFKVGADKKPLIADWSNPNKQDFYHKINGIAGFDCSGHGLGDDYIFLDFDHVLNDDGTFINKTTTNFILWILTVLGGYCEISISRTGLHMFAVPSEEYAIELPTMAGGRKASFYFTDERGKDCPKLEIFYRTKGRYCLLTGNLYECDAQSPISFGKFADNAIKSVLARIEGQIEEEKAQSAKKVLDVQPVQTNKNFDFNNFSDSADYNSARAMAMIEKIDVSQLADSEWLAFMSACKNIGISYSVVDAKNAQDAARYNENENLQRWQSLNNPSYDIETLHGLAKRFGYVEKDFWHKYHKEHADKNIFDSSRADDRATDKNFSADTQIDSLKIQLQEVNKKLAAFEQEKSAAIEKLQSAISFDKNSVFTDEILNAAAFCKLYDGKTFSDFKSAIQNQIKSQGTEKFITEWSGEVRDRINNIKDRQADLLAQKKSINAKIVSTNFVATHDELKDFVIPEGYEISDAGIEKIVGDKSLTVSRVPAFIRAKRKNFEEKTFKFVLAYLSENGKWQSIPAASASTVFNSRKLIDLSDFGLPVTSTNANLFVDFLDAFKAVNEKILPMSLNVSRCGWYNFGGKDYFVEPRRKCFIADDERNIEIVVDDSSTFAKSLKSVGSLSEWTKAYDIAKKSPVARLIVAASVAAPLLKILGERNFMLYIHARTLAGKSTALKFAASAVGDEKIIRSFDATKNGLAGAAADVNDYVFMIDEKQVADTRLKEQLSNLVYALANGVGRTKLNKDSTLKKLQDWRTIIVANGETPLLADNTTGGAFSRLLSIRAPKKILAADDCKTIKDIIENNFGHALPLVVDEFFKYGFDNLRDLYQTTAATFSESFPNLLNEYCRYMAVMTVADTFLNVVLGVEENQAYSDALDNAKEIFTLIPTLDEISDIEREKDFVLGFIAAKSAQFEGTSNFLSNGRETLGKYKDDFVYITARALKQACDESHFDYKKVTSDLIDAKFFIPADKPKKGRKNPNSCVDEKINGVTTNCYRILKKIVDGDD